jgi:phosphatidylinositol-3-phosphatase
MPLARPQQPEQAAGHGAERDLRVGDGETPGGLPGLDGAQGARRQPAGRVQGRTRHAERGDQYAARHDGFTFFRSVTANPTFCAAHILSFRPLAGELARASATPAFSFLAPNLCNDGHDAPCVTGAHGGLAQADRFLAQWVPIIMAAPAYQDSGLIVVTFDEGSDAAACCGETSGLGPSHPSVPLPGKTGPGGGRIGAVLLSPLIRPGTVSTVQYNHYSLLRSIEDIFGLPHLGDAAMPQARSFGADVFG